MIIFEFLFVILNFAFLFLLDVQYNLMEALGFAQH